MFITNEHVGDRSRMEDWKYVRIHLIVPDVCERFSKVLTFEIVRGYDPLTPPDLLQHEYPLTPESLKTILEGRNAAVDILNGKDDRLIIVIGPCSIHDPKAALEYAERLHKEAEKHKGELLIVMRAYLENQEQLLDGKV